MRTIFQTKIVIIVSLFLLGLVIFKCLQNETIFNNTLGRIAITYSNISEKGNHAQTTIVKTNQPFTSLDETNFVHWDVIYFNFMKENSYGKDDTWPSIGTHAFSPLFPFIWRLSHLSARYVVILNYLMFAFSILLLSSLFLAPGDFSKIDQLCLFALALTFPSVFSFYIPYCESTFIFTMSIAIWGLMKEKFWVFFVGLIAFALSRPSFLIVGLGFIATDIYFLILHQDHKRFFKELGIKILPIFIGMFITFFIQYLYSGSFFKMFEVHSRFWDHNFQFPKTIRDWSTEGYGMNIFSIVCIAIPAGMMLSSYFSRHQVEKMVTPVSLFNPATRTQYLFTLCMVYFVGNFMFVFLTQGGNLSGLHRYILVSPFFYIFLFIMASKIKSINLGVIIGVMIPLIVVGYLALIFGSYQHIISFLDMGFFLLVITMLYFIFFNRMKNNLKLSLLSLLILCNTVWITYLFNHFLNNSFIIA